jgi:hypothetical protein
MVKGELLLEFECCDLLSKFADIGGGSAEFLLARL